MLGYGNKNLKSKDDRLSRRGESIYYFGTFLFVAGIILIGFASSSILFFQIHYESEARLITDTITYMGIGLFFVSFGINLMLRQTKKGYFIFSVGSVFVLIAITTFYLNYENNWYYPTISYILLSYLLGFLLLMGNAFGNVTLWSLRKRQDIDPETSANTKKIYTDEEIEKDIDNAIKKSMKRAADSLQFDITGEPSFKVSATIGSESIVKRKDNMDESMVLQQTLDPGSKEEGGGEGIDKASLVLTDTLDAEKVQKKGFFSFIKNFFTRE